MYYLSQNIQQLEKVQQEIDKMINPEELAQSKQLTVILQCFLIAQNVLKETLRLQPSAPVRSRKLTEDHKFSDELFLPKNSFVTTSIYSLHHNRKVWPQADEFVPDRWNEKPAPGSYFPFGGGPRRCIGEQMAMREAAVILGRLVQSFTFEIDHKSKHVRSEMQLTLKAHDGMWVKFSPRIFQN